MGPNEVSYENNGLNVAGLLFRPEVQGVRGSSVSGSAGLYVSPVAPNCLGPEGLVDSGPCDLDSIFKRPGSVSGELCSSYLGGPVWPELGMGNSFDGKIKSSQRFLAKADQVSGGETEAIRLGDELERLPQSSFREEAESLFIEMGQYGGWRVLSGRRLRRVGVAPLKEINGMSQLASRVRDSFDNELASSLEEGDFIDDCDNWVTESEYSHEGSSDEEGMWRLQVANPVVEEERLEEVESCAVGSDAEEAEEGKLTWREFLANVAKSVEVSQVLALRFVGGEKQVIDFFTDLEDREERGLGGQGILSWNVRGLGRGERRLDVRGLLRKIEPDLVAIQDTKLEAMNDRVISEVWDIRYVDWVSVGDYEGVLDTGKWEVPMFTASGLRVRFLKVWEKSGYNTVEWVRYITKAGSYEIRC
ncbi:hypothetical protein HHK36_000503 [Tetracentron sinense]|uniref:MHD domain-containing protein n=1 Tax=Tetracentron sinense TaxID=13715 RepID=A0A834ZS14_TETSI|nr:hypothetical protein HHK36_000503 [Tetracentron sinense]